VFPAVAPAVAVDVKHVAVRAGVVLPSVPEIDEVVAFLIMTSSCIIITVLGPKLQNFFSPKLQNANLIKIVQSRLINSTLT